MVPLLLLGMLLLFPVIIGVVALRTLWMAVLVIVTLAAILVMGVGATALAIAVACFFALFELLGDQNAGWALSLSIMLGLLVTLLIIRAAKREILLKVRRWRGCKI